MKAALSTCFGLDVLQREASTSIIQNLNSQASFCSEKSISYIIDPKKKSKLQIGKKINIMDEMRFAFFFFFLFFFLIIQDLNVSLLDKIYLKLKFIKSTSLTKSLIHIGKMTLCA